MAEATLARIQRKALRAPRVLTGRGRSPPSSAPARSSPARAPGDRWQPCSPGRSSRRHLPPQLLIPGALAYCALATAIGIPAATLTARACHRDDPSHVVIDEVAGQMLTLVAAPLTWHAQLAGFLLFRAFDIVKPPPIRRLELLRPEGVGIIVDDLGAGLYGFLVLQLLLHFGIVK